MTTHEQKWQEAFDVFHEHSTKHHYDRDSPPNELSTRLMSQWMWWYAKCDNYWWPKAIVYEPGGGWIVDMTHGEEITHLTVYNNGEVELDEVDVESRTITVHYLPSEPPSTGEHHD